MFKPTNFDPSKKYPDHQPHLSRPADRKRGQPQLLPPRAAIAQALAELGFIVVEIDGMGTPWRSQEIPRSLLRQHGRQHASRIRSPGMKQLARALPVDRSSTAPASTATRAAATRRPARCSTIRISSRSGISEAGNHDNREY